MSDVSVRSAASEDIGAILELWRQADAPPTVTDDEDALRAVMDRDPDSVLVAVAGDAVVGTLIAGWDGWRGNMYRLAVHPGHRRAGIAARLVAEGERHLRRRGCRRITALVLREETEAVAFWSRAGYEEQPEMTRFRRTSTNPGRRAGR